MYVTRVLVAGSSLTVCFLKTGGRILARGGVTVCSAEGGERGGVGWGGGGTSLSSADVFVLFLVKEACSYILGSTYVLQGSYSCNTPMCVFCCFLCSAGGVTCFFFLILYYFMVPMIFFLFCLF